MSVAILRHARPPSPLAGRLALQSLLFALGEGAFLTGSAVFFTQIVGLSAAQVGLGLTLAGAGAFLAAWPMGKLVDRYGPKKMWAISAVGQAATFSVWPFITDFQGYVAMAVTMEVIGSLGGAAHAAYTIDALPPEERVLSRAYMYSALNLGFTVGAMLGGIALAFDSDAVLIGLPWFTTVVFAVNALAVLAAAEAVGADPTLAAVDMGHWQPVAGRGLRERIWMDMVDDHMAFDLIDDAYNANPTSMAASLEVLAAAEVQDGVSTKAVASPMPTAASLFGSTWMRTAYFCEPHTLTSATPDTVDSR